MRAARPRVAWGLATAGVTIAAAAAAFAVANRSIDSPPGLRPHLPGDLLLTAALCAFLLVGALVAARRPQNPVGWLLLAEGLVWELGLFCAGYVGYAVYTRPGSLPVPELAAWTLAWIWAAGLAGLPLLLGLFPGGLWPGRRWRVVGVAAVASLVLSAASWALRPGPLVDVESLANPVGLNGAGAALDVLGAAGGLLLSASLVAAIAAFAVRYRRASTLERAQLKWFAVAVAVIATGFATASVLGALGVPDTVTSYFNTVPMAALPIAVGVALLRHRLYEIDTVIDRALVATGLAAFATAVYLALVVAAGAAVGRGTGSSAVLVALATAIVAVAFQPLHARLKRGSARLVYGEAPSGPAIAVRTLGGFQVAQGLAAVRDGAGAARLAALADVDEYDNGREALTAIACSETDNPREQRVWPLAARLADKATPYFGSAWAFISQACATWPAFDDDRYAGPFDRKTSAPLMVVNARYDAFSSLARARTVAESMPGARLLTVEGPGHTLEGTDSACADRAVERYLVAGKLPQQGATCEQDSVPFG